MTEPFRSRHVHSLTGSFLLAILVALILAVVWTGRSRRWFVRNVTLRIVLPETGAAGIRQGSEVYFLGTLMGTVSDVSLDRAGRMEARVNIRRDFFRFVRVDSAAVVKRKFGVVGDAYFEVSRGTGQPLPEDQAVIVCHELEVGALEATIEEVRREAVPALKKLGAGLEAWTRLATDLGETRQQLHQLIVRLDELVAGAAQGQGLAGKLLVDPESAAEFAALLAKANTAAEELTRILEQVGQAGTNLPAIAEATRQSAGDLPALVNQTRQTMWEIERLVRGMQRHWLLRKYVGQADAATNQAERTPAR